MNTVHSILVGGVSALFRGVSKNKFEQLFKVLLKKTQLSDQKEQFLDFMSYVLSHRTESSSQLYQDIFALFVSRGKKNGYYIECCAHDGEYMSNSKLLESKFGWNGTLIEPNKFVFEDLKKNRPKSRLLNQSIKGR